MSDSRSVVGQIQLSTVLHAWVDIHGPILVIDALADVLDDRGHSELASQLDKIGAIKS